MTTDPRGAALLDQAQAAHSEARAHLHQIAELTGLPATSTALGPVTITLADAMIDRGIAGGITLCPHLSYDHPAPAHWCAYAPGRLRCDSCLITTLQRVHGTREDRRCDGCGTVVPRPEVIYAIQVVLPPMPDAVKNLSTGQLEPLPPITMHFGLCPECRHADNGGDSP
jgi:hypothetical protein